MSASTDGNHPTDPTATRLQVLQRGYEPVPIVSHKATGKSPGKRPSLDGWQEIIITPDVVLSWADNGQRSNPGTGLRTGRLLGVDIDVRVPDLAQTLRDLAVALLG